MKRIVCLICSCCVLVSVTAQISSLAIATDKTTSLIFPFPIRHVDRGTKDILVQQVKEADNILLVKAASPKFSETNLSVVTGDGGVYTFCVNYNGQPSTWIYYLPALSRTTVASYANGILDNHKTLKGVKDKSWEMKFELRGIYIKDDVLYYQLQFCNGSPIDYDIELLKFYIRDKKKGRRTAIQENEMVPVHVSGNARTIKAHDFSIIVVALDKFTIPDNKYLAVQVLERNGGRHLKLRIQNKHLVKAMILPDLK